MSCDFAARSSDQQADYTHAASTQPISSNNSSTGSCLLESQLTSSELTELELLHNYSTSTCFSLAEYQEVQHIWKTQVPQIGFDHLFVLEMVFSLSAYHLARVRPDSRDFFTRLGQSYHNKALVSATALIMQLDENNCEAVYLSAAFTSFIMFAKGPRINDYLFFGDECSIDPLLLIRGVRTIFRTRWQELSTGKLAGLFRISNYRLRARSGTVPPELDGYLMNLRGFIISNTEEDDPITETYLEALDGLVNVLGLWSTKDDGSTQTNTAHLVFVWLYRSSDEFVACLQGCQPIALVLFAHIAVLLGTEQSVWYVEGWARHIITGIQISLPDEYQMWLQWPAARCC